ncbi:hypothetical protein DLAC_04295 [Tieghemostelium lacteum]|uniref:Uncharacterized protein n=1 Tax=Tieghemostelium lacteum TaxID=361077 RepID=A0A151ZJ54_TIELA|nr:hypothetical protein DLAC_04295 [Tieghemostelium lacteum]|eukprot:KYQ94022.1 hypothetical protein DLAC_04295 [Tieghemostelium lacteum]
MNYHFTPLIKKMNIFILFIVFIQICSSGVLSTSEVYSCGGFVKIHKSIDKNLINLDHIKVRLISASDNRVLETTDCSPNGYYFLPIYDKGNYFFEIQGPSGWSFKNSRIPLSIKDDDSNQCQEDINFELNGFQVSGKIESDDKCKSRNSGLGSIEVNLLVKSSGQLLQSTKTNNDGSYQFNSILPPSSSSELLVVEAKSNEIQFENNGTVEFSFQWDNVKLANIIANGFPLVGKILSSEQQGLSDVTFKLYQQGSTKVIGSTKSLENGQFKFIFLSCGQYQLKPEYQSTYDIQPQQMSIQLDSGGTNLSQEFKLLGFSVKGRVINHQGEGIDSVEILLNDKLSGATTDKEGYYQLNKMTSGRYKISAQKEHYQFEQLLQLTLNGGQQTADIKDIKLQSLDLCGRVLITKPPAGIKENPREVFIQPNPSLKGSTGQTTTNSQGLFCFQVQPGTYTLSVSLSAMEKSKGLQFASSQITTTIVNRPQLDITFTQSYSSIQGKFKLLKSLNKIPSSLSATLQCLSRKDDSGANDLQRADISISKSTGDFTFTFRDLLPGTYKVTVDNQDQWSFVEKEKTIEISSNQENKDLEFQQSSYNIWIQSPNSNLITLHHLVDGKKTGQTTTLKSGQNQIALTKSANYEFLIDSCFKFDKEKLSFDCSNSANLSEQSNHFSLLNIRNYLIKGQIQKSTTGAEVDSNEIVNVYSDESLNKKLESVKVSSDGSFEYWAPFNSASDVTLYFQAKSTDDSMLFYPRSHSLLNKASKNECSPKQSTIQFQMRKGLYIEGKVQPETEGVEIQAYDSTQHNIVQKVTTNTQGQYKLGPLYDDQEYQLKAVKTGFNFHRLDPKSADFTAIELGSLEILVIDQQSKQPLSGVLLSLSGEDGFRQNIQTPNSGLIEFKSLYPGQYFLKSFLKEYAMSPSSQQILIKQGIKQKINLEAKRVAFSVYGSVRTLNGMGNIDRTLTIQALDQKTGKSVEESQTNENGQYRLRGLLPDHSYQIRVFDPEHVEISTPSQHLIESSNNNNNNNNNNNGAVKDVNQLDFTVITKRNHFELTGIIRFNNESNLPANGVKLSLFTEDMKNTIAQKELKSLNFFDLGQIVKSKQNLYLQLDPITLVNKKQQQQQEQVTFKSKIITIEPTETGRASIHLEIDLELENVNLQSTTDHVSVPYFGLIVFVLFIITCLYPSKVWSVLANLRSGKLINKSYQRKIKKQQLQKQLNDNDDEFLPKELRSQLSQKNN